MSLKKKEDQEEKKAPSPMDILRDFLKSEKDNHFNFEENFYYKVPCSSLLLTSALGGGLTPGAHRFIGVTTGGKTSCALDFMYRFLNSPSPKKRERRGVYIRSEGRLSEEIKKRSGVKFVTDWDKWEAGTCFVFETNIFETVFAFKKLCLNMEGQEFFFITDSTDGLIRKDDYGKSEGEAQTVAGGALITSVFLKQVGLKMTKRGHIDVYISQYRDQVKTNKYDTSPPKLGNASGARSLEHQANIVLQFCNRHKGDNIVDGGKVVGHYAKCKILKTDNENYGEVVYPIRYGQVNAKSVWLSKEIADMILQWELVKKSASWLILDEAFISELSEKFGKERVPEKIQGFDKLSSWIEENADIQEYLFTKFNSVLSDCSE